MGRWLRRMVRGLSLCVYYLTGWFILRQLWAKRTPPRTIVEGAVVRPLDAESESEVEVQDDPCEAVLVGLEHGGKPRALATDPCADRAIGEPVRLLERDRELSDVKRRSSVRLCDHHRQLYVAACSSRKCSVLACYEQVDGAKQGVPLCKHHLTDLGGCARPTRRVSWTHERDSSIARSEASMSEGECLTPARRSRRIIFDGAERLGPRAASADPSESQKKIEGKLEKGPCMVLLRPKSLQTAEAPPRWTAWLGRIEGFAEEGRSQELLEVHIPSLKQTCVIHRRLLKGSPRDNGAGRISKHWVQKFLQHTHDEEVGQGISVLVARLSEDQAAALNAWDGEVTDEGAKPSKAWQGRLYREILPHADAYLREEAEMSDDFMTPPKPKVELEEGAGPAIPPFPDLDDSDRQGRMEAARRALDQHIEGEIDSEVLQTVATAFDLDHEQLAQSMYARNHRLSYSKPTTPPGLGADQSEMEFARRPVTATMPGGVTVKPAVPRPANPLLPRSSSSISPVQRGGLSLFPKGSGGRNSLVKPASEQMPEGRAGATFGEALGDSTQVQSADRIIHAIDGLRRAQDDDKNLTKGTLSSIKEAEKMDVFLARGCGTLTVELAPGVYGKELFHAGKRVANHARHMLHLIKWPVLMTNRVLLGIAGLWWGGKDTYTLHASDCVTARSEQLDSWNPSSDNKIENRMRPPGVFNTWLRYAENSELVAAWCEELRESRRKLCSLLGTENPRLEDLKLLALAPGADGQANFQFPSIWDLGDPNGYYQTVVVPRQQRQMSRLLHKQLHDHNLKQKKTAGPAEDEEPRTGKAPKLNLKDKEADGYAGGSMKSAYPAGKRLTQGEASRSVEHAPKDPKTNKPICWDAATHMGCTRGDKCQHAHEPLPGLAKLDYTVAMQVIRRGGLKGGPKIDPKEVDGRVAQLRTQAAADKADKIQPSKKAKVKPKPKAKAGKEAEGKAEEDKVGNTQWVAPEDYDIPLTHLETDLQEAVQGPDEGWLRIPSQPTEQEAAPAWDDQSQEERERLKRWKSLEEKGVLAALESPTDYLRSHVIARMMAAQDEGYELELNRCLEDAAEHGHPALSKEAGRQLELLKHEPKAGHQADVEFTPITWDEGIGHGLLNFQGNLSHIGSVTVRDYQDRLNAKDSEVPLQDGQLEEERQCLPLHVGVGLALADDPSVELREAVARANQLRKHLWDEAVEAHAHLGDPPAWIPEGEHFLRQNVHDCLYPHHEKDYRALQTLTGSMLQGYTLAVLRISYFGRLEVDLLHGDDAGNGKLVFVTIHRGHMRLLLPQQPQQLLDHLRTADKVTRELQVEHWRVILDQSKVEDQMVPAKSPACTRCQQQQQRPYRVGEGFPLPPASFESCLQDDPQALQNSGVPLRKRLAFAYGPIGQEVYAGWAGWTKGLQYQGIPCGEPIEYYEDPIEQKGFKPQHDTRDPKVRERLLGLAGAPPGPDVPNTWQLGVVCTSFCDHQLKNGGSRTWQRPQGDGTRPSEVQGNEDAEFAAELCTVLADNGRVFALESSAPSGRYPKIWDLPCMQRLRRRTGAKIVSMAMCAWGLGPPETEEGLFHRKHSWWLVSPELYPWALLFLGRQCPGVGPTHQHAPLKGPSPIPQVPLTRLAQQYAPALCAAWGLVVRAAFEEWSWTTYLQEHSVLKALEKCWTELDAPPWPADPANTLERTLGQHLAPVVAGQADGPGLPHGYTCSGCELQQMVYPCTFCGGEGSVSDPEKQAEGQGTRAGSVDDANGQSTAEKYLEVCQSAYSKEAVRKATEAGNALLRAAGSVPRAAELVNKARLRKYGEHFQKAKEGALKGLSPLHEQYLKDCVLKGVPSRAKSTPKREKARNHGSVRGHEEEMLQKAWKDASYGAVLLCSTETEDQEENRQIDQILTESKVAESPLGRVPKQNPDRTISAEGRPINDMRARNASGSKYDHPPAAQPRHRAVVRQSLWWRVRHPKVPQRCAKRDVPRAFKWHFLKPGDVPEFCTRILGVLILSLVMVFGWVGAPGEFVIWATAAQKHHGSFRPCHPQFNDVVPYTSRWLMDDGVVVEPLVGNRIQRSLSAMDAAMVSVWGPGAINLDKLAEEGTPAKSQLLWGLHLDFEEQVVVLPEPKRIKAKYLLREPQLQRGCQRVRTKLLRELAGTAQYWAVSAPEIAPYLPVFYRLLQQEVGDHEWVKPRGSESELEAAWAEFWDALDWVRLQMEKPWGTSFRAAFGKLLPLRERLALPGMAASARFVGGDATLTRLGSTDWKDRCYHMADSSRYVRAVSEVVGGGDHLEIIGVMELLTFIVLAAARKETWQGQLILYVTDNMNVKAWLRTRRASNRYVRALLLLLQRLEAENSFTVDGAYVRTYHNTLNDWLTREDEDKVHAEMESSGWTRLELNEDWEGLLREAMRPTLKLPGEKGPSAALAIQLANEQQTVHAFPAKIEPKPFKGGLHQIRLGSELLTFELGWVKGGGSIASQAQADWIVCVLTQDPKGREADILLKTLARTDWRGRLIVDQPRELSETSGNRLMQLQVQWGQAQVVDYQTSHHGSFFARARRLWLFGGTADEKERVQAWRVAQVNECQMLPLRSAEESGKGLCPPDYLFTREPNLITTGDKWLPKPVGHLVDVRAGSRHLVHSTRGPACGPRLTGERLKIPGGTLLEDGTGLVRPLLPEEVWEMQGGLAEDWRSADSKRKDRMIAAAVREPGWQVAMSLMQALTGTDGKAGVLDPDEIQAHEQLEVWLRAWGRNPKAPSSELFLTSWKEPRVAVAPTHEFVGATTQAKAGGGKRTTVKPALSEVERLVQPASKRGGTTGTPRPRGGSTAELDQVAMEAVLAKLADSTRRVYASGWKQWALYNASSGTHPFLDGEERSARTEDEQRLIRFVVFLHQVMGRSIGGVRQRLSAIRYAHVAAGYPDPLVGRPRLWAAVAGLQRWEGAPKRKLPVTPNMLRWLVQHLKSSGLSVVDQTMIKGALLTGWFFMMRASELLPSINGEDPMNRALRPADVAFFSHGQPTIGAKADEVVVQIRSSKTDQYGRGQTRSHHRSGGDLCPVEALAALQVLQPHRWRSPEDEAPLFRYEDGTGLDREGITHFIKIAALAAGFPGELAGSHSLRKGGATAFFASTGDLERLKRYGGWSSDAVHAYLYEDHTAQKGISEGMLGTSLITLPSQKDPGVRRHPAVVPTEPQESYPGLLGVPQDELFRNSHGGSNPFSSPVATKRTSRAPRGSNTNRAFSWAPDRKVSFAVKAGAMDATDESADGGRKPAAPDRANAANLFVAAHPGLDLYQFLGVPPGATPAQVLTAYRRRSRETHPDRFATAGEDVQKAKGEEFKMLGMVREILLDPLMATQYMRWRQEQIAAKHGRGRSPVVPAGVYAKQASSFQQARSSFDRSSTPAGAGASSSGGAGREGYPGGGAQGGPPPAKAPPAPAGTAQKPRKPPPPANPPTPSSSAKPRKAPPPRNDDGRPRGPTTPPMQKMAPTQAIPKGAPPTPAKHFPRATQPYTGGGMVDDLRVPRIALADAGVKRSDAPSESWWSETSSRYRAPSSWLEPGSEPWVEDDLPPESTVPDNEDDYVYVEVEAEDDDMDILQDHQFDEEDWDEPAWEELPEEGTGSEQVFQTFDQAVMQGLLQFMDFVNRGRAKMLIEGAPPMTSVPKEVREACLGDHPGLLKMHPSAKAWLMAGTKGVEFKKPPPPKPPMLSAPPKVAPPPLPKPAHPEQVPEPKEPPKALAPKPVPPVLMQKTPAPKKPPPPLPAANYAMPARAMGLGSGATASSSEGAPPTEVNHFGFDESEVDYGDDDDRTPEEKAEDEELLEKTKTKVEAFLRAPPEMRKTLRSQAWKRCKSKLEELNFEFSTRPLPEMHPGKFEKDLKDGFTYAEAKQRQKGRQRAARHQRALAEMEGASFEDFPKSWSHGYSKQVLKPGFLEEKNKERARRKATKANYRSDRSRSTPPPRQSAAPAAASNQAEAESTANWEAGSQWHDWQARRSSEWQRHQPDVTQRRDANAADDDDWGNWTRDGQRGSNQDGWSSYDYGNHQDRQWNQ
ncbi:unnamed protein product [Cladocopium goreaui]|uniref:Integrase/recombinase xerD-like n=1 Tax=Cladocopium goreaui TaxID=2562237 RepID=A0A9P1BRJ5_9DINO|nr:unnamed protein product [Cladocopium goreaui]